MELQDAIYTRAAYRALDPVEITDDLIKEIAVKTSRSPSCANKQPWRFVFVKDPNVLTTLHESLSGGNYWAKKASMIVAVFSHKDFGCNVAEREYYLFGTGMATAHLMLLLAEKGLVAHGMAGYDEQKAKQALNIPEEMTLITLIAVGKHSEDYSMLGEKHQEAEKKRVTGESPRKAFEDFAHIDKYKEKEK